MTKKDKIYFIEGRKVDLNSSEWDLIYEDGRWNSRGVNLYYRKSDIQFILENWSNWQGEKNTIELLEEMQAIEWLLSQDHPERINKAFERFGYEPKAF